MRLLLQWCLAAGLVLISAGWLLWTGAAPPGNKHAVRVRLQLAVWGSASELQQTRQLLQAFHRAHPGIQVALLHIPEQYFQKLHLLLAAGLAPDVMMINNLQLPVYAAHGQLQPFPALAANGPPDNNAQSRPSPDFFPQALAALTYQGQLYALPRDVSVVVMYLNLDLLAQADLPLPAWDWDWATCLRYAQALTQPQAQPRRFGLSFQESPPLFWLPYYFSANPTRRDGRVPFRQGQAQPDASEVAALQTLAHWRLVHGVSPLPQHSGTATMTDWFLKQRVAMLLNGRWVLPVLRDKARFRWAVRPFPRGPAGSRVGVDATGYAMAAGTKWPREARQLLAFLTSPAAMAEATASGLIVPARRSVALGPVFQRSEGAQVFLAAAATGLPTQTPPQWSQLSETWMQALAPVWEGRQSAASAMRAITPELNRLSPPLSSSPLPSPEGRAFEIFKNIIRLDELTIAGLQRGKTTAQSR